MGSLKSGWTYHSQKRIWILDWAAGNRLFPLSHDKGLWRRDSCNTEQTCRSIYFLSHAPVHRGGAPPSGSQWPRLWNNRAQPYHDDCLQSPRILRIRFSGRTLSMLFVRILAISGACLLAGCQASQQQEMTQAEALDAANAYVAREFPATNVVMSRPVLEDRNATWRVKYPPPEG